MSTPAQFVLGLGRFVNRTKEGMDILTRKVVLDIGTRVVMLSPVGDPSRWASSAPKGYTGGHFRGNWQYGANVAPKGALSTIDKSGGASINRIAAGLASRGKSYGKVHWLVNNLPYAQRLETGWSKQAPAGMVGITVREFQNIVRLAAQRTRSRS